MPWYFIPRVLKLTKAKIYVRSGYDGDSETVNVLARHTALKCWTATEIRWYRNVVPADRLCNMQSVALLSISAMRLWASSAKGPRVSTATEKKTCEWRRAYCCTTFPPTGLTPRILQLFFVFLGHVRFNFGIVFYAKLASSQLLSAH